MWDERYASDEYVYGLEPNDFLKANFESIPMGEVLCLAEGEGRNAVFLAQQGYEVTAVDSSARGLEKAQRLASAREVKINTIHADLNDFIIETERWSGIVSIFCHLPPPLRVAVHQQVAGGLKPGGAIILEAYTPDQLMHGTGGPPVAEMMMDKESVLNELGKLEFLRLLELEREIHEGQLHNGLAAVVQAIAIRSE
jgi:2-polyprenyl-3-methyl-5-hydroxy-6-metoxy-1,4-benzoquinol methylase